jgi:hypothetical protein
LTLREVVNRLLGRCDAEPPEIGEQAIAAADEAIERVESVEARMDLVEERLEVLRERARGSRHARPA